MEYLLEKMNHIRIKAAQLPPLYQILRSFSLLNIILIVDDGYSNVEVVMMHFQTSHR